MSRLGVFFVPARIWYFLRGLLDIGGRSSAFLRQHTADCTSTIGKFCAVQLPRLFACELTGGIAFALPEVLSVRGSVTSARSIFWPVERSKACRVFCVFSSFRDDNCAMFGRILTRV